MSTAKRMPKSEVEAALKAGNPRVLREVTDDIEPQLVIDAVMKLWGDGEAPSFLWHIARHGQGFSESVIRGVLERLKTVKQRGHAVFFLEAVRLSDGPLQAAWANALRSYLEVEVNQEAWGSKLVRERIAKYAKSPLLPAFQAAVVAGPDASMRFLAVLARDASDASLDALVTRFSTAVDDSGSALARLQQLKTHAAKTPEVNGFFEAIEGRLAERTQSSGVLEFMKSIGFEVDEVDLRVSLSSADATKTRLASTQGTVIIDSSSADWFQVHIFRITTLTAHNSTRFTLSECTDKLGLGRCAPNELPQWLQQTAKKLKMAWADDPHFRGTLRGKKRQQFIDWLLSK
ncbi:MAG: hypothetical protein ACO1OB_22605 [Archangium sp.]